MNKRHVLIALGLTTIGALAGFGVKALADGIPTPNPLYYSGTLTEGGMLVNVSRHLTVNLWLNATPQTGEVALCSTDVPSTPVQNGRFRINLDGSCKAKINANPNVYAEVIVGGITSLGRAPVGAVPYAVEADHAVNATTAVSAATANAAGGTLATNISAIQSSVPRITSWTSYAPAVTAGGTSIASSTTTSARWRRVGDSVEVKFNTTFTSCPQSGQLDWTLPTGITFDSTNTLTYEASGDGLTTNGTTVRTLVVTANGTSVFAVETDGDPAGGMSCTDVGVNGMVRASLHAAVQGWTVTGP